MFSGVLSPSVFALSTCSQWSIGLRYHAFFIALIHGLCVSWLHVWLGSSEKAGHQHMWVWYGFLHHLHPGPGEKADASEVSSCKFRDPTLLHGHGKGKKSITNHI